METNRYQRVKDVFAAVVDAPADERAALLTERCVGDDGLRLEVESLLRHAEAPVVNIDKAALQAQVALSSIAARSRRGGSHAARSQPGDRIGGYRILSVLGEGGMGIVYLAEQDRPRRTVALKVIKPGYVSAGMLRRFEHETQVLGRLQHPGIAQIFEAGTADSGGGAQPYFAMEYVRGKPLLEYADQRHLGTRERLDLLIRICEAAHHAHTQGVIHRDLKPANILVESADGLQPASPTPKILDFGIARTTDADIHTTTLRTDIGQLIGTIPYMSPEQVAGDPSALDARSDIYALGVIGYELLTGRLPHDLQGKTIPEAVRIIGERDPTPLSSVNRFFRGDLDTIISKALEREPGRRYGTAADLAADIRRYLDDHPIVARPPSVMYQMSKFAKRNRAAVAAMTAVFLTLLVSIIAVSIYAFQATIARDEARSLQKSESAARTSALANADQLQKQLSVSNIERGRLQGIAGNIGEAEALLWTEHLRDPQSLATHWALWELYSREPCMATFAAGSQAVCSTIFAPDNRTVITSGQDGVLRFFDAATQTWKADREIHAHSKQTFGLDVSDDGATLASGSDDGTIKLWNMRDGSLLRAFPKQPRGIRGLDIAPDGMALATGSGDGVIRIWDMRSGEIQRELRGHSRLVSQVRFNHDGSMLFSASSDGTIGFWPKAGQDGSQVLLAHPGGVGAIALTPDEAHLISGGWNQAIRIWDARTFESKSTLELPNGAIRFIAVTPDSRTALVGGWWNIERVNLAELKREHPISLPSSANCAAVSADGAMLVAGFPDGLMRAWEIRADRGLLRLGGHDSRVSAAFRPDGAMIAAGDNAGTLRLWDAKSGSLLQTIPAHTDRIRPIIFHPTQPLLFTGGLDGFMHVWNTQTGKLVREIADHNAGSNGGIDISPDGNFVAYACTDRCIRVMSWPQCETLHVFKTPEGEALSARFSPDGQTLVITSRGEIVKAFEWRTERLIAQLATPTMIWITAFSPDGNTLYGGAWTKDVRTWDLRTKQPAGNCKGHNGIVSDVKVRPGDARMLATASADGTVKLWDSATGQCLCTLTGFDGWEAITVSFSPDGRRLAAASRDGEIVVWDLEHYDQFIAGNIEYQRTLRNGTTRPSTG